METGTASSGMIEARQVCRKTTTTSTTSSTASSRVLTTESMALRTNTVGSKATSQLTPSGKVFSSSVILARTASESAIELAPGASKITTAAACWLSR